MDFLVKLLQSTSKKGGSGHSPSHNGSFNKTSSKGVESPRKFEAVEIVKPEEKSLDLNWQERTEVITKFDHESYVQFAREFVEELVETAVKKSEKDCSLAIETETHSVTSLSISEGSFQSADHSNGNTSAYLPDLLQPEALYKRQTETDTDTNEYESATETEPPDVSEFQDLGSPSVGPLVNEVVGSLDETCLINGHSSLDTTLVQSSEASVLPITKDFPSISNSGIGDSFIDKFQRLKIDGSYIDAERSTDSSAEESEYLPCESSLIESESFSNNSQSESFPVDSNNIVSDIVVDTSVVKGYEDVNPVASLVNESEDTLPVTSIVNEPEDTLPVTSIVNEPEDNIPVTSVLEEPESNIPVISIVNDFDNIIPFTEVVDESEKSVSFIEKDLEICKTVTSPLKEFQNQVLISDVESEVLNTDSALLDSSKHIVVEPENRIPDISLVKEPELDTSILSSVKEPESNVILSNFVDHNILDSTFFVDSVLVDSSKSIDSNHNSPRERLVQETKKDASLFVSDPEVNQKVESIYLGAGDSNSFGIKETFAFSSFKDSLNESVVSDPKANEIIQDTFSLGKKETSFNSSGFEDSLNIGNETVILVPKESENEYKEGEEGSVNVITDVCKEIPVQETIFSKYLNESALLTELRDLCHSQEEKLKDTGASIDFTENRDECISAKPLLVPSHSSDYGDSIGKAVNNDTEVSVKESDSAEDKFSFLDEVDDFSNLALEAAKISQELLLVCKSVDCDTQSSSSYPLEDDYSYGSSSQDMTDNCNKVEGHSPVNRRSSPQISKSSNLSGLPQSEISDDDNKSNLEIDPFKRRSKLNSSPPLVNKSVSTGVDPFKRRSRIQNSPPPEANERDYPRSESDTKQSKQSSIVESSPKKIIEKVTIDQVASPSPVLNPEVNLSEAGPDIAQDEIFQSGDVFKDPSTFDFLSQAGSSNPTVNLRTESLYVKFDPLYSAVSTTNKNIPLPSSIMANSAGDASNAMASSKTKSKVHDNSELVSAMPKKEKAPEPDNKIMSELHSKSPAMNTSPNVKSSPDSKQQSPTAAAANGTIDQNSRPLSMVGGLLPGGLTMAEVSMARELLARKEAEMEERVAQERLRAEAAEKRAMEAEEREKEALKLVAEKTQVENQMSVIMQEYEKTISRVVAEKEQAKQKWEIDQENLKRERDEALTHLNNVEQAFSDVHRKYERSKTAIEGFKRNEDALTASVAECQANLRKQEQRYEVLKSHAEAQLEGANQELECVRRAQQLEITKLSAMLKKTELRLASLEETVDQKEKENQELVAICDELIGKLGAVGVDAGK